MWERPRAGALALAVVVLGVLAAGASAATQAGVSPAVGHRHTRFTVSFETTLATGSFTGLRRSDEVSATGPQRSGCVGSMTVGTGPHPAGASVSVRLAPGVGHAWCTGRYQGQVVQFQTIVCGPPKMVACPMLAIAPQTIARFRFRVH